MFARRTKTYFAHDEDHFCVTGDKVVIKSCDPLSIRKNYYVRNIVKPFARADYYQKPPDE